MKQPVQVVFRGMEPSDAIEQAVRQRVEHLERFDPNAMACRVVVDQHHMHRQQGRPFGVTIELTTPGIDLVVNRVEHVEFPVALREAFDAMKRRLEDAVRERRGDEKHHAQELRGEVARLNAAEGFGFVVTSDGQEYYFGRENLASGRFDQLQPGTPVQFIAEPAGEGWQAKRISLGKRQVEHG